MCVLKTLHSLFEKYILAVSRPAVRQQVAVVDLWD
jgi:hypothetical protein